MKVLFCTDGSLVSFNAIKNFSKWFNDFETDVLSVTDITYFNDYAISTNDKFIEQCSNNVSKILKSSEDILSDIGIKSNNFINKCGSPVDNILSLESDENYEFIVMGSNGKKGFQKWLGSVSQEVAYKASTKVYISKYEQIDKRILFPINNDFADIDSLKNIINLINLTNAKIDLLSTYQMPEFLFLPGNVDSNWILDVELTLQKELLNNINSIEKLFINGGYIAEDKVIVKGSPSEEILRYIDNNAVSLVYMNMNKSKINYANSIISKRILEYANCDVIINKYE